MTQPPEYVEHRTETQQLEDAIVKACQTIREHWTDTLPTGTRAVNISSGARGGGIIAADNDPTDADIDPVTRALSARRYVLDILTPWCRLVMEDRPITNPKSLPHGQDIPGMCAFLERQAQWLSGHDAAPDVVRELRDVAAGLEALQPPKMSRDDYLRTRRPDRWLIGRCPLPTPTTDAQPKPEHPEPQPPCDGKVYAYPDDDTDTRDLDTYDKRRDPWATCSRCGTRGVASWWESQVFPHLEAEDRHTDRLVGIDRIVEIAASEFGRRVSKQTIWQWVSRGRLTPIDRNAKPHQFKLCDVIDALTAREAG